MLKYIMENHGEKVALGGVVCLLLGAGIFLGMTPRRIEPQPVGKMWVLALPFFVVGALLLILNWYWYR